MDTMTNLPPLPSTPGFKDRKIGLVILGSFTVLAGGLCALLIPLMLFGSKAGGGATNLQLMLPAICIYGTLAVALIWLGIGSMPMMIVRMQQFSFLQGNSLAWITLLSCLPWLIYLLWVEKFFRQAERR